MAGWANRNERSGQRTATGLTSAGGRVATKPLAPLPLRCSTACPCSGCTTRVHVARRPDATVEVSMPECDPFVLPAGLGALFVVLASDGGRRADGDQNPVGFKSSQLLVHT